LVFLILPPFNTARSERIYRGSAKGRISHNF
jgi:hypothetical protein